MHKGFRVYRLCKSHNSGKRAEFGDLKAHFHMMGFRIRMAGTLAEALTK